MLYQGFGALVAALPQCSSDAQPPTPTHSFAKGPKSQAHADASGTRASGSVPLGLTGWLGCQYGLHTCHWIGTKAGGGGANGQSCGFGGVGVCAQGTWGKTMGSRPGPSAQRSVNGGRGAAEQRKGSAL